MTVSNPRLVAHHWIAVDEELAELLQSFYARIQQLERCVVELKRLEGLPDERFGYLDDRISDLELRADQRAQLEANPYLPDDVPAPIPEPDFYPKPAELDEDDDERLAEGECFHRIGLRPRDDGEAELVCLLCDVVASSLRPGSAWRAAVSDIPAPIPGPDFYPKPAELDEDDDELLAQSECLHKIGLKPRDDGEVELVCLLCDVVVASSEGWSVPGDEVLDDQPGKAP